MRPRLFAALSLGGGLVLLLLTPPNQAPDELAHLFRAWQLSEGRVMPEVRGGQAGAIVPRSMADLGPLFPPLLPAGPRGHGLFDLVRTHLGDRLDPADRLFVPVTTVYSPLPYVPQALAVALGRSVGLSPLLVLGLARLANLAAATALLSGAIAAAPAFRAPLAVAALLPMALFLRASTSADAVTTAAAFLFLALSLRLARPGSPPSRGDGLALVAAGALVGLCKTAYAPLALLALAIPAARPGRRRPAAAAALAAAATAAAWTAASAQLPPPSRPEGAGWRAVQLATLTHEPQRFVLAAARDVATHGLRYGREMLGTLGWLDAPIPVPFLAALALALVAPARADGLAALETAARFRPMVAACVAGPTLLVLLAIWIVWTPPGARVIEGVQGRYFLPLLPAGLLLLARRATNDAPAWATRAAVAAGVLSPFAAAWGLVARYR